MEKDLETIRNEVLSERERCSELLSAAELIEYRRMRQQKVATRFQAIEIEMAITRDEQDDKRLGSIGFICLLILATLQIFEIWEPSFRVEVLAAVIGGLGINHLLQRRLHLRSLQHRYRRDWEALGLNYRDLVKFAQWKREEDLGSVDEDTAWKRFQSLDAVADLQIIWVLRPDLLKILDSYDGMRGLKL